LDGLLKKAVDDFGRLSFVLETYVKLVQTGDHAEISEKLLEAAITDSYQLSNSLQSLNVTENVEA